MGLETFLFQKKAWGPTAADRVHITHDYFMTTRYFVPCYLQLMFTETLLRETDETAR